MKTLLEAAEARSAGTGAPADRPRERRWCSEMGSAAGVRLQFAPTSIRAAEKDGVAGVMVGGVASTTEDPYEMYDMFGPYTEIVSAGAFAKTLAAAPLVEFTLNHGAGGGLPMAHTRNSTLSLSETDDGLDYEAFVDPTRSDVADMLKAMERGDLAEASFKFRITRGMWSPDYTEYRIDETDLNRGDVSAVNFGANPNASSGLRMQVQADGRAIAAEIAALRSTPAVITDDDCALRTH